MPQPERPRQVAWVIHPLKGDVAGNIARAKRWLQFLIRTFPGLDFEAGWILWCEVLNDANPAERERGLQFCEAMIHRLDEVWVVGGRISEGMQREIEIAGAAFKPITNLTYLGEEPPIDWKPLEECI